MENPASNHFVRWLFLAALTMALFLGCRQEQPTVVETTTPTPGSTATEVAVVDPTIAAVLTNQPASPTAVAATPSITPTSDACPPPDQWLPYTVRPQDTLFSLSQLTDTAVDEIKSANCLLDDFLAVGQILYLPVLPPPPAVVAALPTPQTGPTPCPSPLNCTFDTERRLVRSLGGPNNPDPCPRERYEEGPFIHGTNTLEAHIGNRTYYFACNFTDPQTWTVGLEVVDGREIELIQDPYLPQDLQIKIAAAAAEERQPQLVLAWDVTCETPPGEFTLQVVANQDAGNTASLTNEVIPPFLPEILVAPEIAPPGSLFEIYFCYFPPNQPIIASLYYDSGETDEEGYPIYYFASEHQVDINSEGHGMITLQSHPSDPPGKYLIYHQYLFDSVELDYEIEFTLTANGGGE